MGGEVMKIYSTFLKIPELETHGQRQFSVIPKILVKDFYPSAVVHMAYFIVPANQTCLLVYVCMYVYI